MGVSNGTTALGIAVALGEVPMPKAEQICKDLDLYSSVASCSSGVELTQAQIVLLGNKAGAGGRYRIGHSVMRDALDIDGIYDAIRNAGIELPERPRSEDLKGRVVNCFMKCEADRRGVLRGRRQIMLDDSDVHHHRHAKAAVGGVAATRSFQRGRNRPLTVTLRFFVSTFLHAIRYPPRIRSEGMLRAKTP